VSNTVSGVLVALVGLALMFRWGMRTGRLRRQHGPPPGGAVRFIFEGVTVGYVIAGGALVAWVLGDTITPGGVRFALSLMASVAAFWAGRGLEPRLTPHLPKLRDRQT